MKVDSDVQKGYELACKALGLAYAPYSRYKVGCALKIEGDDTIYSGCNVENVVYPAGVCAERAVISSLFGHRDPHEICLQWLVVVTDCTLGDVPCGICQQVIAEFGPLELPIYIANLERILACHTLKEIRPLNDLFPHQKDRYPSQP